jgi:short-subunit dehydrogenase
MTNHLKEAGTFLASVNKVAKDIVTGIEKGHSVIYTPAKWSLIMMVVRHLPNFIFNRVNI